MHMCTHKHTQTNAVKIQRFSTFSSTAWFLVTGYWFNEAVCGTYVWVDVPGKVGRLQRCLFGIDCLSFALFISTTAVDRLVVHQLWLVEVQFFRTALVFCCFWDSYLFLLLMVLNIMQYFGQIVSLSLSLCPSPSPSPPLSPSPSSPSLSLSLLSLLLSSFLVTCHKQYRTLLLAFLGPINLTKPRNSWGNKQIGLWNSEGVFHPILVLLHHLILYTKGN